VKKGAGEEKVLIGGELRRVGKRKVSASPFEEKPPCRGSSWRAEKGALERG